MQEVLLLVFVDNLIATAGASAGLDVVDMDVRDTLVRHDMANHAFNLEVASNGGAAT